MAKTMYARLFREFYWDKISAAFDAAYEEWKEEVSESSLVADEIKIEGLFPRLENGEPNPLGVPVYMAMEDNAYDPFVKGYIYIGSVFSNLPSGKYYTFWTTNQTAEDVRKDESWWNAMNKLCDKYNMLIESGEGDPTDLFLTRYYEYEGPTIDEETGLVSVRI